MPALFISTCTRPKRWMTARSRASSEALSADVGLDRHDMLFAGDAFELVGSSASLSPPRSAMTTLMPSSGKMPGGGKADAGGAAGDDGNVGFLEYGAESVTACRSLLQHCSDVCSQIW
jgi:hypothetical protein